MIALSPKAPAEVVSLSFDFTDLLAAGETIVSASFGIAVEVGSDPAVATMLTATEVIVAGVVSRLVRNGVAGVNYRVTCLATTSQSQVLLLSGILPVRDQS